MHGCHKGKDTKPEMIVRRFLFSKGLRYRVNNRKLPGSPDIVLRKYRTVIFIDGCFWHGHKDCRHFHMPKSNTDFWRHKINMNMARDYRANVELRLLGMARDTCVGMRCEIKRKRYPPT